MSDVLSLQCARERAWQPTGGSNGHAFEGLGHSVWKYKTTERDGRTASNQKLLERLEAENAQLRENVVELALQIQVRWLRLSEQNFRVDKWSLCRG